MVAIKQATAAKKGRRFALLMAARDSEYVLKKYGGYRNVFLAAFGDAGADEKWDLYRAIDGELPGKGDLEKYDGFVISGSPNDAYGDDEWILRLCRLIRDLHARRKRVLGVCFGHQVAARWEAAWPNQAPAGTSASGRWLLQICRFLDNAGSSRRFVTSYLPVQRSPRSIRTRCVWEVPAGAEVLASSAKTGVEMFRVGEHLLGIQGHPEYTNDILVSLVDRLLGAGTISASFAEAVKKQLDASGPDREFWLKLCKSFLKADERSI
ncbi:hypothetical protein PR202_ga15788 [Eleusine coracana subsp. coracana]|uniref:Glutamine amidotransferase domain-containing protein n=1 Tax=Eleusine coracana subsp. coracana TaxID=191504 RepID=A0AAV5CLC8_ELECO|nr:hypothetical protein PR202_ga15788 [Eleusine coracana subsp. coracana]